MSKYNGMYLLMKSIYYLRGSNAKYSMKTNKTGWAVECASGVSPLATLSFLSVGTIPVAMSGANGFSCQVSRTR